MSKTVIIDYGMGNIGSVAGALRHLGADVEVTSDREQLQKFRSLVLPGVGSFFRAMGELEASGLADSLRSLVLDKGAKILGICLGMQLLADYGEEGGGRAGLGLVPGQVGPFHSESFEGNALNIGFSGVEYEQTGLLYKNIPSGTDFYFVHEYRLNLEGIPSDWTLGIANHESPFVASYERENVMGVQFHPEKSQTNGLALLKNFLGS